jgi:hypothetical protein
LVFFGKTGEQSFYHYTLTYLLCQHMWTKKSIKRVNGNNYCRGLTKGFYHCGHPPCASWFWGWRLIILSLTGEAAAIVAEVLAGVLAAVLAGVLADVVVLGSIVVDMTTLTWSFNFLRTG